MRQPEPEATHAEAGTYCASYHQAVELLGKRWSGAIVAVLMAGPRRFSELALSVPGLSERLLAERLKELEAEGVVSRRVLPGPPVGVEYELTDSGRDLGPAIEAIAAWARRWVESRARLASPVGSGGQAAARAPR